MEENLQFVLKLLCIYPKSSFRVRKEMSFQLRFKVTAFLL